MTLPLPLKMRLIMQRLSEVEDIMGIMVEWCHKTKRNRLSTASTNSTSSNSSHSSNHQWQGWQVQLLQEITKKLQCCWSIVTSKENPKLATVVTASNQQWFTQTMPSNSIIIIVCHTITICHLQIWVEGSVSPNSQRLLGWVWSLTHLFIHLLTLDTSHNTLLKVEFQIQAQNFCTITSKTKTKPTA